MGVYAQDGVNIAVGDLFSAYAARQIEQTYNNSPYVQVLDFSKGHFRGPRVFNFFGIPDRCKTDIAPDGVGTKTGVISFAGDLAPAARDILAMTCGDITRWGGLPLVFSNVLDVGSLGCSASSRAFCKFKKMIISLREAAREQGVVLFKGETAELGKYVGSDNKNDSTCFNWAGFALGVQDPLRFITGDQLKRGMILMALREHGFRSNGLSSARKAFAFEFGPEWYKSQEAKPYLKLAAAPSVLYDRFLAHLNGWYSYNFQPIISMFLIVHVTGGAIESKLARDILFPRGLSAELDNLWNPPKIMRLAAQWREMKSEDFYATWNGGQGAIVAIAEQDERRFVRAACMFGLSARRCGRITRERRPVVKIHSRLEQGVTIKIRS